jgi:SAM-dependent methyltransferase
VTSFCWLAKLRGWYERHRYDFVFYRWLEKRALLPWLSLKSSDRVCELGSFNGANARQISLSNGCSIYGVDIDQRIVQVAQSHSKTERTHFLVASAQYLPFASESFDKVYGISVLEHFANPRAALKESFRCLKKGGVLAFTTDSFALGELWPGTQQIHREKYCVRRYYSGPELSREIESAGFRLLHTEPVLRHWSSGFLFELSVRVIIVKSAAFLLLPLLRWIEKAYGSDNEGYMQMVCAKKPEKTTA